MMDMNTSFQQSGGFNSGIFITFGSQNLMDPESCNLVFLRDMFSVLEIRDEIFSSLGRLGRSGFWGFGCIRWWDG